MDMNCIINASKDTIVKESFCLMMLAAAVVKSAAFSTLLKWRSKIYSQMLVSTKVVSL